MMTELLNGFENKEFIPVVGIGASAGGLEAISAMLNGVSMEPGIAFVIIQHLDPDHHSALVQILSQRTHLEVVEANTEMEIEPNKVYVIPPAKYLYVEHNVLKPIIPNEPRGLRMAVDYFFSSLAEDAGEYGIGVILSGTGRDGTAGMQEIKYYGGLTIVQDPREAGHPGMPESAIENLNVDYVLPASKIGPQLESYLQFCQTHGPLTARSVELVHSHDFAPVLQLLRKSAKHDFRKYRKKTLARRIQRRMGLYQLEEVQDYVALLNDNPQELEDLRADLLIGVTRFFRDHKAWKILEEEVLPDLFRSAAGQPALRIWSAGCASGEEAYSIAILLHELRSGQQPKVPIQIFATDVAEDALDVARNGLYPESVVKTIPTERLRRFFSKEAGGYRVSKQLRESIIFAKQNILVKPPFANIDLILCRNLLIYLQREAQDQVLDVFQFALKERGVLFQGSTESVGKKTDLFQPISKKWRIFRRTATRAWPPAPTVFSNSIEMNNLSETQIQVTNHITPLATSVHQQLLRQLDRAVVVINSDDRVILVEGEADSFLQLNLGQLTAELPRLVDVARKGLVGKIRSALRQVKKVPTVVTIDARVFRNGAYYPCQIQVSKLLGRPQEDASFMFLFTPLSQSGAFLDVTSEKTQDDAPPRLVTDTGSHEQTILELDHELRTTREQMQSTISELIAANEELKASNEEAMTMNEEMQSSNEELETSKEELQSLNEELTILNNQLELKIIELETTTDDLNNLLASSDVPTVFLDTEYKIRRFTPSCDQLFSFIMSDVGRSLSDITPHFDDSDLQHEVSEVLRDLQPREKTVKSTREDRYFRRRILPYRTEDNRIQGVVITFNDITALFSAQKVAQKQLALNETIYASAPVGLAFVDTQLRFLSINKRLADINGFPVEDHLGKTITEILPDKLGRTVQEFYERVLRTGEGIFDEEISGQTAGDSVQRTFLLSYVPVQDESGKVYGVNSVVQDITESRSNQQALVDEKQKLHTICNSIPPMIALLDVDHRYKFANFCYSCRFGTTSEGVVGKHVKEILGSEKFANIKKYLEKAFSGDTVTFDMPLVNPENDEVEYKQVTYLPEYNTEEEIIGVVVVVVDVTDRKQLEQYLKERERFLNLALSAGRMCTFSWDVESDRVDWSDHREALFGEKSGSQIDSWSGLKTIIDEEDKKNFCEIVDSELKSQNVHQHLVEFRVARPDFGSQLWLQSKGIINRDQTGKPVNVTGIIQDVTDRKLSEIDLLEREAHLRRVINNQIGFVGVVGKDGTVLEVDDSSLRIAGVSRDEVIGTPFAECLLWKGDKDISAHMEHAVQEALKGDIIRFDLPINNLPDGRDSIMLDFMISPVRGGSGEVEYLVASAIDISERHYAKAALDKTKVKFEALFEQNHYFTAIVNLEGTLTKVNKAALSSLGMEEKQVNGKYLWDAPWWAEIEASRKILKGFHKEACEGIAVNYELKSKGLSRLESVVDFTLAPAFDAQGQVMFLIATAIDITNRLEREKDLALIATLNLELNSASSSQKIIEIACEKIVTHMNLTQCVFLELDEHLSPVAISGELKEKDSFSELLFTPVDDKNLIELHLADLQRGRTVALSTSEKLFNPDQSSPVQDSSVISLLVPHVADGSLRYLLLAERSAPAVWSDSDKNLARELCSLIFLRFQRALATEDLAASNQRLALAMESAKMGSFWWEPESDTWGWDDQWCEAIGVSRSAPKSWETFTSAVVPADRDALETALKNALRSMDKFKIEFRVNSAGDKPRWIAGYGRMTINKESSRLVGLNWDISDQKYTTERIRLAEQRLRSAAEAAGFGMLHMNLARGYLKLSPELLKVVGLDSDTGLTLKAMEVPDWVHPSDRIKLRRLFTCLGKQKDGRSRTINVRVIQPESHERLVHLLVKPLFDKHKDSEFPAQIIGTAVDITERWQFEESLKSARLAAESANEAKSSFLAHISHEIRTPMTAILGYSDILKRHLENPDDLQCAATIKRNGEHLLEIINDILDISRIEAGKLQVELNECDLRVLLSDIFELLSIRLMEKDVEPSIDLLNPIPGLIITDRKRLRQVLVNLVGNAAKFTESGFVKMRVKFDKSDDAGVLIIEIADSGIGIDKQLMKKLFEPFYQGSPTITRKFGGSGLGLSISRGLIRMLGGTLAARSEPGKGSTFRVELPVETIESEPVLAADLKRQVARGSEVQVPAVDANILLVDDRDDVRHLLRFYLEQSGATVATATDGVEAIELVKKLYQEGRPFDLIVMDMHMPELDGDKAASRLKSLGYSMPILALTADAMSQNKSRYLEAGCDAYLSKPVEQVELLNTVSRLLEESKQHISPEAEKNKILLVDDSRDAIDAVSMLLGYEGFCTEVAYSGAEAREYFSNGSFKAILLDIGLGDESGHELAADFRSAGYRGVLLALSGLSGDDDIAKSIKAGFDDHVVKPVDPVGLARRINELCAEKQDK